MSFLESKNAFDEAQGTAMIIGGGWGKLSRLQSLFKRTFKSK